MVNSSDNDDKSDDKSIKTYDSDNKSDDKSIKTYDNDDKSIKTYDNDDNSIKTYDKSDDKSIKTYDNILSIDIGIKNLGWAYFNNDLLTFDIYTIDDKKKSKESVVMHRCKKVEEFFKQFEDKPIDYIVIERQVNNNTMAMELMYAITMKALTITENIFIFDPKLKFTFYNEEYTTKNKLHKKRSVEKAREYINTNYENMVETFESHDKLDDISDAINQGLTYIDMLRKSKQTKHK